MKVLYVGSGMSALQAKDEIYNDHVKVCLNNAWRIYEGGSFDYWIHPDDFSRENYPQNAHFKTEIRHKEYSWVLHQMAERIGLKGLSGFALEKEIGYTAFFQGLYWIMGSLAPDKIGLLGFDHDYNPEKTKKWYGAGMPHIHNKYNNKTEKTVRAWADAFFDGCEPDAFYGYGTPDPLRYGAAYIERKMRMAVDSATALGITITNYSRRESPFDVFERSEP